MIIIGIIFICFLLSIQYVRYVGYEKSEYKQLTGTSFGKTFFNKGLYGEYLIVKELQKLPGKHKTLVNLYIPKTNGDTTEIDVIFIHESMIYVIESKNYSGWIYGRERDYKWTQVFQNKKKYKFYNPIKQNRSHIQHLQRLLSSVDEKFFYSLIVFSNRCTLKSIDIESECIEVINRNRLHVVKKINALHRPDAIPVNLIYNKLLPYTNVEEQVKEKHINDLRKKHSS